MLAPLGFVIGICVLHDTGSDALTLYERDLRYLDPFGVYPWGPLIPTDTADGVIHREHTVVMIRVLNAERTKAVGERVVL
jgi:hypothetical protein